MSDNKNFIIKIFLLILLVSRAPISEARWANYEDMSLEIDFFNNDIEINSDGTSTETIEIQQTILKESGRSSAANYTLYYNGDSAKITLIEAKTIHQGKEYKVKKEVIEDKPLASSPQGFDQTRQILLSFPNAEIGAKIYLKYIHKHSEPTINNVYTNKFFFGNGAYWNKANLRLKSKLPLNIKVNDPDNALKITQNRQKNIDNIEIELTRPICKEAVNEGGYGVLNNKHKVWVSLSSLTNWEELALKIEGGYNKILDQPLPPIFKEIAKLAEEKTSETEQINLVTSLLNEKIQYMGDWRSMKGRFFPRDLDKIATSQIGDCKDFSASTGAILKNLGYEVYSALVKRGVDNLSHLNGLPDFNDFNHAFLKVIGKEGTVYWIDPTNVVSMAQGVFPDIADKMALVLSSQKPSYELTSNIDPKHAKINSVKELKIDNNIVENSGIVDIKGEEAQRIAGSELYLSKPQIRDFIFYALSQDYLEEKDKLELILPSLSSRIVEDIKIKFSYIHRNHLFKTNLGPAITLNKESLQFIFDVAHDQVNDIFSGLPSTMKHRTIISNMNIKQIEAMNYEKDTPWLYVKRIGVYRDNKSEIEDTIIIKKAIIPNEDLKTPLFRELKDSLEKNIKNAVIILN